MIDIHNHILFGIDDGCKTIEDAIATLKDAQKYGITSIILTPHYIKGTKYNCNNQNKEKLLAYLKEEAKKNNININLYLGNEVYIENDMLHLIKTGEVATMNYSKYLLFELPMRSEINNLNDIVFSLRVGGVIPIIAHPERYTDFQKDPSIMIKLIEQGCLFQGNMGSLNGLYGKEAEKAIKVMLKHNYIHFMASDVHHSNSKNYTYIKDAYNILENLIGSDFTKEITCLNQQKIINNEMFEVREPKEIKKKLFFF